MKPIRNSPFWLTRLKGSARITSYRSLPAHSDPATMASLNLLTLEPSFWQLPRPGMRLLHGSAHTPWSLSVETFFIHPSYLTFSRRPPLTTLFNTSICLQPLHPQSQAPKPTLFFKILFITCIALELWYMFYLSCLLFPIMYISQVGGRDH